MHFYLCAKKRQFFLTLLVLIKTRNKDSKKIMRPLYEIILPIHALLIQEELKRCAKILSSFQDQAISLKFRKSGFLLADPKEKLP